MNLSAKPYSCFSLTSSEWYRRGEILIVSTHNSCVSLQELKACYEEMKVACSKTPRKKKLQRGVKEEGGELGWVEVLMDTLLGLLSRSSLLWRGVVNQVFRMVAHHVTRRALGLAIQVSGWGSWNHYCVYDTC